MQKFLTVIDDYGMYSINTDEIRVLSYLIDRKNIHISFKDSIEFLVLRFEDKNTFKSVCDVIETHLSNKK